MANKLEDLRNLPKDWNGYGADPIPNELIDICEVIYAKLEPKPKVFPTARNSIQFEYEMLSGKYLEFEIFAHEISVYYEDGRGESFEESLPHDSRELVRLVIEFHK
jgi:hypothetical protein